MLKVNKLYENQRRDGWIETVENYIRAVSVCIGNVNNRDMWRLRTKIADIK